MTHKTKTPLALAIGTAFAASLAASNIANAAPNASSNPFAMSDLNSGYMQVASSHSKESVLQAFKEGSEPVEYAPEPKTAKSGQFFQFDMDFQ